ncbi:MAG: AAA family ATPase [Armatimonadetes bacterium]|nr:AAA family ATPase [Armatimonadota bacterium]
MYIDSVHIKNIRSLIDVEWNLGDKPSAGWHVIIGDNGAGKSTFLRSISLALLGNMEAQALSLDWKSYLREGTTAGDILLEATCDKTFDKFIGTPSTQCDYYGMFYLVNHNNVIEPSTILPHWSRGKRILTENKWGRGSGWFSAAYGPFRRFTGGENIDSGLESRPELARHISLFKENIALPQSIEWLKDLNYKKLEQKPEGELLNAIIGFINQEGFLPNGVRLTKVSSDGVEFEDSSGAKVKIEELSDGYRSILSMTLELIRQLSLAYPQEVLFTGEEEITVRVPGVVLIDEVDVHLHPTWQRSVGLWFRKHFPQIQFIVTSHSPLVCQSASVGTVWRLPLPGEGGGGFVEGIALDRLLYGDILDAYGTNLFGVISRSEDSQKRLERLASLNVKALKQDLATNETEERRSLRAIFSSMEPQQNERDAQ